MIFLFQFFKIFLKKIFSVTSKKRVLKNKYFFFKAENFYIPKKPMKVKKQIQTFFNFY